MIKRLFNPTNLLILVLFIATFLRLYRITTDPPSLFGDELDLGYQAYSILKTGKDYQGNFLPIHFHSIAEWRTPLYLYSAVPTIGIFGITPLGVRLPASMFGVLGVLALYLLVLEISRNKNLALISAFLLAISPWHLQYSRAGFEVTEMIFFLVIGIWLFLKSLRQGRFFPISIICLVLTPWVYSTAKLFTPLLLIFLFITYRNEILSISRKNLVLGIFGGIIFGLPIAYSSLFGGGAQRFSYISIFSDPTTQASIGASREQAARIRGEEGAGLTPSLTDKFTYNKFTYWGDNFLKNYFSAFSTSFLFIKGDPDPRQSTGQGEFYRIEIVALVVGIIFFFSNLKEDLKTKSLVVFWLMAGAVPSSLTVDGGNHATRLILILPPLVFLISYGYISLLNLIDNKKKMVAYLLFGLVYMLSIFFYLHEYYTAYIWNSERWWHYGWGPSVNYIKSVDSSYNKVIISMTGEPAWIFFAGWYQYSPLTWQKNYPIGNDVYLPGFGKISHTGKYYFGSPDKDVQIYGISKYIDTKTLYLANASEVGENLILHPEKSPQGLKLLKIVSFPSGEPAFYIFRGER